jgi:hypothetical protein
VTQLEPCRGALMETTAMLVLSTAHMSPKTASSWIADCPWACFDKGEWGWFMYVCDDAGITEAEGVPLEIRSALHVARRLRCEWIMWDRDGPVIDELPEYDWGSVDGHVP